MSLEDLDFSDIPQVEDIEPVVTESAEAPFAAQVGRGMLDVYQGTAQLAAKSVEVVNSYVENVDKAADTIYAPGSAANIATKALLGGFARLVPDIGDAAEDYSKSVSEELKLYNQDNPDFQVGRVLGSIATPLTVVPGGTAKTLGGKILTGMGAGSLFSLTQPVENTDEFFAEKGEQALWGAGFGGAIPVGGKILGTVTSWIDEITKPMYKSGITRDISKFLKEHITENKDKIIRSINQAVKTGDKRTVGQIIADTTKGTGDDFGGTLVRLEKDLARESDALKSLYARQSVGRRNVIDAISGTEDGFIRATQARADNGVKNYTASFAEEVIPDNELKKILSNKFSSSALKEAQDIAETTGTKSITEVLHFTKLGLDKQLAKSGDDALSVAEKKAVKLVKEKLVGWMEVKNPSYRIARETYKADSLPINRMKVGQELKNRLVNSLEKDSPSTYAAALRNAPQVIKKSTGDPRYKKLDDLFSPEEVSQVKGIATELTTEARAKTMAAASKPVLGELSSEIELSLPHILSRPIVITNHILSKFGQDKSKEYKAILNSLMRNPDEFVRLYGGPSGNTKTKMAIDIARRLNTMAATQQPAREMSEEAIREQEGASIDALDLTGI